MVKYVKSTLMQCPQSHWSPATPVRPIHILVVIIDDRQLKKKYQASPNQHHRLITTYDL